MYSAETRVAFKGQIFTAPMDWSSIQKQLELLDKGEIAVALPITGAILAARVRISITSGLVDGATTVAGMLPFLFHHSEKHLCPSKDRCRL